jgi:membrane protease YdiL (CAAX protease family)
MVVRVRPVLSLPVSEGSRTPLVRARSVLLALTAVLVTLAAVEVARVTSSIADVQTQWPTLVLAVLLVAAAPRAFGVQWGRSAGHLGAIAGAAAAVATVVAAFRAVGGDVPWSGWEIWVAVPLAEELLFRGFLLTALLWALRQGFDDAVAARAAIGVSALVFGLEHLGNLDVAPALVATQVAAALAFGVLAGWLRVRTDSLVGPVVAHGVMNLVAVL